MTQYNGPRVRDTNFTLMQGHKNMARPVDKNFKPWGGPPFSCTGKATATDEHACVAAGGTWDPTIYPADDTGNTINWTKNTITTTAGTFDLKWIYGDWLGPLPRAIYTGATLNNMSYSCGRCHTTGWTSDAGTTPNASKHPELDFPGITWNGTGTTGQVKLGGGVAGDKNVMSSWDQWGITCSRCHFSAVDDSTTGPPYSAPGRHVDPPQHAHEPERQQRRLHRRPLGERSDGLDARGGLQLDGRLLHLGLQRQPDGGRLHGGREHEGQVHRGRRHLGGREGRLVQQRVLRRRGELHGQQVHVDRRLVQDGRRPDRLHGRFRRRRQDLARQRQPGLLPGGRRGLDLLEVHGRGLLQRRDLQRREVHEPEGLHRRGQDLVGDPVEVGLRHRRRAVRLRDRRRHLR